MPTPRHTQRCADMRLFVIGGSGLLYLFLYAWLTAVVTSSIVFGATHCSFTFCIISCVQSYERPKSAKCLAVDHRRVCRLPGLGSSARLCRHFIRPASRSSNPPLDWKLNRTSVSTISSLRSFPVTYRTKDLGLPVLAWIRPGRLRSRPCWYRLRSAPMLRVSTQTR